MEKTGTGLIDYLTSFLTENRNNAFDRVLDMRTRYITVVLEDFYHSQNASAVLRTCDCFGIQDVHVIENRNQFKINTNVVLGASQWLTMYSYSSEKQNTIGAVTHLRKSGYQIVATTPHNSNEVELAGFDLSKGKVALFFGTERFGVSETVMQHADAFLKIPMFGFTESLNVSVSASIILHHLTMKLHSGTIDWKLSETERNELKLYWLRTTLKHAHLLEKEYWCRLNS